MARIGIDGDSLIVDIEGMDKLWSLQNRLTIPLAHVRSARVDAEIGAQSKGWRGPGSHVPGVLTAGTYHQDGERIFWDVHDGNNPVVVELQEDTFRRLVVQVDDPQAAVALIERVLEAR